MSALDNLRPLNAGEYDLANISLIGFDPVSGRSFEECHDEWKVWFEALKERIQRARWWQISERIRIIRITDILSHRMGMR